MSITFFSLKFLKCIWGNQSFQIRFSIADSSEDKGIKKIYKLSEHWSQCWYFYSFPIEGRAAGILESLA
jgi:hypothetical protein